MIIMLLGAPGAGKGTQAVELAKILCMPHISTGVIFRANIKEGTELGKLAASIINKGMLVPDDVTFAIVKDRLSQEDCADGAILDGFPRTIPQARMLDEYLESQGKKLDVVINIVIDEQEIVKRLSERRVCPECKATYHLGHRPPANGINCDVCGAEVILRDDDKPEVVQKRLDEYHVSTEPLIEYYKEKGNLIESKGVNGIRDSLNNTIKALVMRNV
ncbi:MAG: adenylate kinase [Clostridia bacterium]|nr:adenylate kinase [Clostridia bacterium]